MKMKGEPLRQRMIRGGLWSIAGLGLSQIFRLGGNLIMTRLLMPEMFGLMAVVNSIVVGLTMFSDLGLRQHVVQSEHGDDPVFLNTVWTIQIVRGLLLCGVALGIALAMDFAAHQGWFADNTAYGDPHLVAVLAVISVLPLAGGCESTKVASAFRHLLCKEMFFLDMAVQVCTLLSMILWAMWQRSIWALVFGSVFGAVLRVVLGHVFLPGVANRLCWNRFYAVEVVEFGKWIFLSSIVYFLLANGDRLMLGGLVSAHQLGIYNVGFFLAMAVFDVVMKLQSEICFPVLSEVVRSDATQMKRIYYRIRKPLDVFSLVSCGFLLVAGQAVIDILYDSRYADAGWVLQILSLNLVFVVFFLTESVLLAMGDSKSIARISFFRAVFGLAGMYIGYFFFNFTGFVFAVAIRYVFVLPLLIRIQHERKFLNMRYELLRLFFILPGLLSGLVFVHLYQLLHNFFLQILMFL